MKRFIHALTLCAAAFLATGCSDEPALPDTAESIVTTRAGKLETLLGDRLTTIETLSVEGPMDFQDFWTIRRASVHGHLRTVNLTKASVADNELRPYTFAPVDINCILSEDDPDYPLYRGEAEFSAITLPDNIRLIREMAFAKIRCGKLVLPETVIDVHLQAFNLCICSNIYIMAAQPPYCLGEGEFHEAENRTLYVPDGSRDLYSRAPGWHKFGTIIETSEFPTVH